MERKLAARESFGEKRMQARSDKVKAQRQGSSSSDVQLSSPSEPMKPFSRIARHEVGCCWLIYYLIYCYAQLL